MNQYRPNVCVVVRKAGTDLLLLCHRAGFPEDRGWQFPQGGLHKGADLIQEMRRELREEIGTDDVTVILVSHRLYAYRFPEGIRIKNQYVGQIQKWILVEFKGDDHMINFAHRPAEFDAFTWTTPLDVLDKIVYFKLDVYTDAMCDLGLYHGK
jgi:putative (di)nucleoside polyphosphate hydrolase